MAEFKSAVWVFGVRASNLLWGLQFAVYGAQTCSVKSHSIRQTPKMEARRTHQRHMAGYAVGMLLQPSRGIRDDITRAGGKPKDHMKENVKQLRTTQKTNKQKKEDEAKPVPPPFKLKEFTNIMPKISTRREQNSSKSTLTPNTPDSSRPSTAYPDSSSCSIKKNFIAINHARARSASLSKPITPAVTPTNDPKHKPGQVPKYLVDRKHQWAQQEEQRIMALEKCKIPKGMMLLEDLDRIRTLNGLKSRRMELMDELSRFPMIVERSSLKARKAALENSLNEIDKGIMIFSRAKVFVPEDTLIEEMSGSKR
ncbi:hypothetical protein BASA62_004575 [Batrachochytrium salamandrivorans]|nr:hypothetical protein BASA62_004575 [Batrachochytrium salamandrivorans]